MPFDFDDKEDLDIKAGLLERIMNAMASRNLEERQPRIFEVKKEKPKRNDRLSKLFED